MERTLCLVMIVKNEAPIITRALDSIAPHLDFWVVCDTGSTDGTQDVIKTYFEGVRIPGELHQHEWTNFGANRSRALALAFGKADYLFLLDADVVVNVTDPHFKSRLTAHLYMVRHTGGLDYCQDLLVDGRVRWKFVGVTHEALCPCDSKAELSREKISSVTVSHLADGANRSDKFSRDLSLLLVGIRDEPENARYRFYLAQTYFDMGSYEDAETHYLARMKMGGWAEEIYYAAYKYALAKYKRTADMSTCLYDFLHAFRIRPSRLEALYQVVLFYRTEDPSVGYAFGMLALKTFEKYPADILFIDAELHRFKFQDELAVCAYYAGHFDLAIRLTKKLLGLSPLSTGTERRLQKNLSLSEERLKHQRSL